MDLIEAPRGLSDPHVRHPWETARFEVVKRLIARHVQIREGAVVVDIGCGDAFVVGTLAAMFPAAEFYGVDSGLTPEAIGLVERRLSMRNLHLCQHLDALTPKPRRPAALVLLMDVLEHVEDDEAFLKDLLARDVVDPQTCVLITVPAYAWLISAHDVFLRHFRRYTNRTLRQRLEHAGLRVIEGSYFFLSLLPLRMLQVLKERLFGRPATTATDLMTARGRASAALLTRALVADARVGLGLTRVGITVPGLSTYAICRKSA